MQVRTKREARGADGPKNLSLLHPLSRVDVNGGQVKIRADDAQAVVDEDRVSAKRQVLCQPDDAVIRRLDRRPSRSGDVDPSVESPHLSLVNTQYSIGGNHRPSYRKQKLPLPELLAMKRPQGSFGPRPFYLRGSRCQQRLVPTIECQTSGRKCNPDDRHSTSSREVGSLPGYGVERDNVASRSSGGIRPQIGLPER